MQGRCLLLIAVRLLDACVAAQAAVLALHTITGLMTLDADTSMGESCRT